MKKFLFLCLIAILVLGMFAACSSDDDPKHTDPAFLEGEWEKVVSVGYPGATFTITDTLEFECIIEVYEFEEDPNFEIDDPISFTNFPFIPTDSSPYGLPYETKNDPPTLIKSCVTGTLNSTAKGLGPNDYKMLDMDVNIGAAFEYLWGNITLGIMAPSGVTVESMSGVSITLKPSNNKDTFTFSSANDAANAFFKGTFNRK